MYFLPSVLEMESIENSCAVKFPSVFRQAVYNNDWPSIAKLLSNVFAECRFVKSPNEFNLYTKVLPSDLIPFMYSGPLPSEGATEIEGDVYCFRIREHEPTDAIAVFSVHTVVAQWLCLSEFIKWAENQASEMT